MAGSAALAVLGATVGAVESSGATGSGTVTGVVAPCVGVMASSAYAGARVRISLQRHGETVTTETVHGRSRFRLVAPAGEYLLRSSAGVPPRPLTVVADATTRLDLVPTCKQAARGHARER